MNRELLPYRTSAEEIYNSKKHHCSQEGRDKSGQTKITLIDRARHKDGREEEASQEGTDNPDDDIQHNALIGIRTHDQTCEPSDNSADDEPDKEVHRNGGERNGREIKTRVMNPTEGTQRMPSYWTLPRRESADRTPPSP